MISDCIVPVQYQRAVRQIYLRMNYSLSQHDNIAVMTGSTVGADFEYKASAKFQLMPFVPADGERRQGDGLIQQLYIQLTANPATVLNCVFAVTQVALPYPHQQTKQQKQYDGI